MRVCVSAGLWRVACFCVVCSFLRTQNENFHERLKRLARLEPFTAVVCPWAVAQTRQGSERDGRRGAFNQGKCGQACARVQAAAAHAVLQELTVLGAWAWAAVWHASLQTGRYAVSWPYHPSVHALLIAFASPRVTIIYALRCFAHSHTVEVLRLFRYLVRAGIVRHLVCYARFHCTG